MLLISSAGGVPEHVDIFQVLIVEKVSPSRRAELMEHWSVGETDYEKYTFVFC